VSHDIFVAEVSYMEQIDTSLVCYSFENIGRVMLNSSPPLEALLVVRLMRSESAFIL